MNSDAIKRFWSKVEITPTCWIWRGTLEPTGYGKFHPNLFGTKVAHRISYMFYYGDLPPFHCSPSSKSMVCHRCDVRNCVNPLHLFLGTAGDNARDMMAKNRSLSGDRSPSAKLTWNDVNAIRKYFLGRVPMTEIAKHFGVHSTAIRSIKTNRTWKVREIETR